MNNLPIPTSTAPRTNPSPPPSLANLDAFKTLKGFKYLSIISQPSNEETTQSLSCRVCARLAVDQTFLLPDHSSPSSHCSNNYLLAGLSTRSRNRPHVRNRDRRRRHPDDAIHAHEWEWVHYTLTPDLRALAPEIIVAALVLKMWEDFSPSSSSSSSSAGSVDDRKKDENVGIGGGGFRNFLFQDFPACEEDCVAFEERFGPPDYIILLAPGTNNRYRPTSSSHTGPLETASLEDQNQTEQKQYVSTLDVLEKRYGNRAARIEMAGKNPDQVYEMVKAALRMLNEEVL